MKDIYSLKQKIRNNEKLMRRNTILIPNSTLVISKQKSNRTLNSLQQWHSTKNLGSSRNA